MPPHPTWRRRAALLLLSLSLGACVSARRPATSPPGAGTDTVEPASHPAAVALCEALHALPAARRQACCGGASATLAGLCVAELSRALAAGTVGIDGAAVDRCAAASASQLAGCDWVTPLLPSLPAACQGLVRGTLAAGASCASSLECLDGLYCRGVTAGGRGVCAPPDPAGGRCEVAADPLSIALRSREDPRHPACDGRCAAGRCLPLAVAGAACPSSALCAPGLRCVVGRCVDAQPPAVGEACDGELGCAEGAVCLEARCVPPKGAGEPCRLPFECRARACEGSDGGRAVGRCADPCASP